MSNILLLDLRLYWWIFFLIFSKCIHYLFNKKDKLSLLSVNLRSYPLLLVNLRVEVVILFVAKVLEVVDSLVVEEEKSEFTYIMILLIIS